MKADVIQNRNAGYIEFKGAMAENAVLQALLPQIGPDKPHYWTSEGRAITDMLLARSEHSSKRFYSMSNEMKILQKEYYEVLEKTQKGDGDISVWLLWFLDCFDSVYYIYVNVANKP